MAHKHTVVQKKQYKNKNKNNYLQQSSNKSLDIFDLGKSLSNDDLIINAI